MWREMEGVVRAMESDGERWWRAMGGVVRLTDVESETALLAGS